MKKLRIFIFLLFCGLIFSCSKSNNVGSPTMSASINGGTAITFSASDFNQLGMTGTGNGYTIQIILKLNGSGTYTLADPSTGNYATVATSSATYTTSGTSTGQVTLTENGTTGSYNGTFFYAALDNGNSIVVSNGQFTNM